MISEISKVNRLRIKRQKRITKPEFNNRKSNTCLMFHTNTVYETRTHSSGVRIETDTRERLETKQTSIIQSTYT